MTIRTFSAQKSSYAGTFLSFVSYELFYHTFTAENNHNYEVDFLLSRGNKIVPIEVKSSDYV